MVPIHGKGKTIINLATFRRVSVSLNDDEEGFMAMQASSLEKIMLLECYPSSAAANSKSWPTLVVNRRAGNMFVIVHPLP